jgi:hypothetical protein
VTVRLALIKPPKPRKPWTKKDEQSLKQWEKKHPFPKDSEKSLKEWEKEHPFPKQGQPAGKGKKAAPRPRKVTGPRPRVVAA